jgi:hypothetical protein
MRKIEKVFGITKKQRKNIDKMCEKTLSRYKSAIERLQHA